MLYPKNIEQKIAFNEIRQYLTDKCHCELGKEKISNLSFSTDKDEIKSRLLQIKEMTEIMREVQDFPTPSFSNVFEAISRMRPDGTYLLANELHILRKSLNEIIDILSFFHKNQELYPALYELAEPVEFSKEICKTIDRIVDSNGNLKDNASAKLIEIRSEITQKRRVISKIMSQKLAIARQEGWIEQDSELSVRDGRLVIPLNSTHKRKIQGIVHDESATGKTSFVEPVEAFETNNAIANLEFEEQKEIIRILREAASEIRPFLSDIECAYDFLGTIDAITAKTKFSIDIEAECPTISEQQELSLIRARHPLLFISFKKNQKEVIPLHILLNKSQRIIVISGPNAGGKSVCMKTVLLLQYMFQCGLPIPADSQSTMSIFNNMLIDIGDEQSIENDLSTYSSHLLNMKIFLERANNKTLLAIDEFGTGTEPILGGAIAESVLETLNAKGAFGIITTHYSNLKHIASSTKGLINGAMLFDMDKMKPLYKLRMGSAGNSFAFEIAKSIGLPQNTLEKAKTKIKQEHIDFDENLKKLEIEKQYVFKKKEDLRKQEIQLESLKEEYSFKLKKINEKRQEIIENTEREINAVLDSANKQIEQTIRVIKEAQAEKETTKQVRSELQTFVNKTRQKTAQISNSNKGQQNKTQNKAEIHVGSYVKIKGQSTSGEVLDIQGKQATVSFGNIKMNVKIDSLESANKPKIDTHTVVVTSTIKNISEKRKEFKPHLDLRGVRGDDAMYQVKDFVETANMLQIKHLEILHGKGYGILRKLIRDYLNTVDFVLSCEDAPIEMGGDGITIVKLQ
ncbi:MAG: Smr/MutS family protein [Bacteroidales bacterium]|nr:Smr/MutS family protein [Bacteroidales bacterium]